MEQIAGRLGRAFDAATLPWMMNPFNFAAIVAASFAVTSVRLFVRDITGTKNTDLGP